MTPRVGACQFEPTIGDVAANLETMRDLGRALPAETDLAVYPELCVTGYALADVASLATPVPGPVTDSLVELAAALECSVVAGLPERDGESLFNATVIVSPSDVEATYRKCYPWGAESSVFAAGDGPVTVETPVGRVGLCCCYDLNFPELALEYARLECDVLAVNAAWRASFLEDWRLLSRARARDGVCYVVAANHTGTQNGREHAGHSLVAGPGGTIRADAGSAAGVATAPVSEAALEREHERNPVRRTRLERGDW
jgi:predicted amidohydrolase